MEKLKLLKKNKNETNYIVQATYSRGPCLRISLNPDCGFKKGDIVQQFVRESDGALIIIPVKNSEK